MLFNAKPEDPCAGIESEETLSLCVPLARECAPLLLARRFAL